MIFPEGGHINEKGGRGMTLWDIRKYYNQHFVRWDKPSLELVLGLYYCTETSCIENLERYFLDLVPAKDCFSY